MVTGTGRVRLKYVSWRWGEGVVRVMAGGLKQVRNFMKNEDFFHESLKKK